MLLWAVPAIASAEVIEVNTTADALPPEGGEACTGGVGVTCTLREAIEQANSKQGPDTITFSALPPDEHQLTVEENSLPTIFETVTIEGDTAPGATPGVPALELVPVNMNEEEFTTGFQVQGGTGTRIEGFAIGGFSAGIEVSATEGAQAQETQICGNYIGTDLSGEVAAPNHVGVELWSGDGQQAVETEIGGVGCPGNVISANVEYGIWDEGIGTSIAANSIGIGSQPSGQVLPNGVGIIEKERVSNTVIGGTDPSGALANVIAENEGAGVRIEEGEGAVAVRHDSFFGNEGPAIERAVPEPPAPEITLARSPSAGHLELEGFVSGMADGLETVEVDIYGNPACDESGAGEGQTFLGTADVSSEVGFASFATTLFVEPPADDSAITATMTTEGGSTSEFSTCAPYEPLPQTFVVTTLEDSFHGACGPVCSLRDAIEAANEFPNKDTIKFDVAGAIKPDGQDLPWITAPVIIDGTTAPGYEEGKPVVEIDGSEAANEGRTQGLTIFPEAPGTIIEGLAITNFQEGIEVDGNHSVLDRNVITNNSERGIFVEATAPETAIRRTVLFENGEQILFSTPNSVPEPVLEAFAAGPSGTSLFVPLKGALPNHEYAIDVFANAHCEQPGEHGPAEVFLGTGVVTTDGSGEAEANIAGPALAGINAEVFTVTATDLATGTTSQIGHCAYSPIETAIESKPPAVTSSTSATFTFVGVTVGHVAGFECELDGAGFSTCPTPKELTGLAPGSHTFKVRATNGEGVTSAPATYTWEVDTEPPEVSITSGPSGTTNATTAAFGFTATDSGSGVTATECKLDSGAFEPCTSPQGYTALADGPHTFEVRAKDAAGNTSVPVSRNWTVDTTPPTVSITSGPSGTTKATTAEFEFTATDSATPVTTECSLDGAAFSACTSPKQYPGLSAGPHTFEVKGTDAVGNTSDPMSRGWTVDTTPPTVSITAGPSGTTAATAASFGFTATDSGSPVTTECSLDGAAFAHCESPQEYTALVAGPHTFEVKATDEAGNTSAPVVRAWKIQTAAPPTSITAAPQPTTESTAATFEFGEAGSGGEADGFECRLDDAAFAPCASPRSFAALAPGAHTFAVRTTDEAGNKGEPTVYTWTVSSPPQQAKQETQAAFASGPEPTNGEKVVVAPEEGKVLIKLPGTNKFVPLEELKEIPVGAVIDATKGKVKLTSVDPDGSEQSATFFGGVFKVKQREGANLVVLELLDTTACTKSRRNGGKPRAAGGLPGGDALVGRPPTVLARPSGTSGKLWGSGHGNFRTEGNQGSATVRGTIWLVEDRCDGTTFFRTRRGIVSVRDFVLHKTLPLPAGKSYVAGEE